MIYVMGTVHEMLHHYTGAMLCKPVRMSLNTFAAADDCPGYITMSAIGPAHNYLCLWLGALLIWTQRSPRFGLGLVADNHPRGIIVES